MINILRRIYNFIKIPNERVWLDKHGKDTGGRENDQGHFYVDKSVYLQKQEIKTKIKDLSNLIENKNSKYKDKIYKEGLYQGKKEGKLELINEIIDEMEKIEDLASDEEDIDYFQLSSIESYIDRKKKEIENQ